MHPQHALHDVRRILCLIGHRRQRRVSREAAAAMRTGSTRVIIAMLEVDIRDRHGDAVRRRSRILAEEIRRVRIEAAERAGRLAALSWQLQKRPERGGPFRERSFGMMR